MNSKKLKKKDGITLIALVITIIVMLILVGVTISMAINGGLFNYAGKAVGEMQNEINAEQDLSNGGITIEGNTYNSIDDYLKENLSELTYLPYDQVAKNNGYLTENAIYESDGYTAVIPKGFKVSEVAGEKKITTGLVIKDENNNEFVWIPVTDELRHSYTFSSNYSEPAEGEEGDYSYGENINYTKEYADMVKSVNGNNGFYIGRYETTTDNEGNIGSKYNTEVLATNYNNLKWREFYSAQKNANVTGNGTDVQTAMIYGVLWDKTMEFIRTQYEEGNTTYTVDAPTHDWHGRRNTSLVKSGQLYTGSGFYTESDVMDSALNVWGLEGNASEYTQEMLGGHGIRVIRGGACDWGGGHDCWSSDTYAAYRFYGTGPGYYITVGSRLILFVK